MIFESRQYKGERKGYKLKKLLGQEGRSNQNNSQNSELTFNNSQTLMISRVYSTIENFFKVTPFD